RQAVAQIFGRQIGAAGEKAATRRIRSGQLEAEAHAIAEDHGNFTFADGLKERLVARERGNLNAAEELPKHFLVRASCQNADPLAAEGAVKRLAKRCVATRDKTGRKLEIGPREAVIAAALRG